MAEYNVTSRILSSEEKLILFGKALASKLTAVKALDLDNYLGMFRAMYEGQPISIPGLEGKGFERVYIYCDLPIGSRYFNENNHRHNSSLSREEVYGLPFPYVKSELNDFFVPLLKDALQVFPDVELNDAYSADVYYTSFNTAYGLIHEALLGACFLNVFEGKIVSISTYSAISDMFNAMNIGALRGQNSDSVLSKDMEAAWYNIHFQVPPEVGKQLVDYKPDTKFEKDPMTYLSLDKGFFDGFSSLFTWLQTNSSQGIVIAPDYFKLNGYYKFNNKRYFGLNWTGASPLTEHFGRQPYSGLTVALEQYLYTSRKNPMALNTFFSFTDASNRFRYSSNAGTFLYINKETVSTSPMRMYTGVPELFELDKDFLESITQVLRDEVTTDSTALDSVDKREKFRKREFAVKREGYVSLAEVENTRYMTIQNTDSKLFILTKTSKAKEAARKMAITRKITAAVSPVVDMAVRIFAATDFETGLLDPDFKFPLNSRVTYDAQYTDVLTPALSVAMDKAVTKATKEFPVANLANAKEVIKSLYEKLNYDGTPFYDWAPQETQTRTYRNSFVQMTQGVKEANVLGYSYGSFKAMVGNIAELSNLYSPSSGQLNFIHVGYNIYSNAKYSKFPKELIHLQSHSSNYRNTMSFTGKQCYHMHANNFIGDNEENNRAIDSHKNTDQLSYSSPLVTATTAYTFSEPAMTSFTVLKKCKTFKDYQTWFDGVKSELETRLEKDLLTTDFLTLKTTQLILNHFQDLLIKLAIEEAPYLPKEEEKKRGRKKKEEESETDESELEGIDGTTPETSPEQAAMLLAALTGAK